MPFEQAGDGPPVVLLHGFPLDRSMWSAQAAGLSRAHRVIAPDLRGLGKCPPGPERAATMEAFAGDVIELLDRLGVSAPVGLAGLSMGGYVALALALDHPERIDRLALLDTRAAADSPDAAARRQAWADRAEAESQVDFIVEAMLPNLFGKAARDRGLAAIDATRRVMAASDPQGVAAALRGMAIRRDCTPLLAAIRTPTLVIVGSDDALTPCAEAEIMAQGIKGARLEVIPEAGHMTPLESPDAVTRLLCEFFRPH